MNSPDAPTGGGSYRFAGTLRRLGGVLAFALAAGILGLPALPLERSWGLDSLYTLRGTRPAPPEVLVVAMNAAAARALDVPARPDRWPRALHAELVEGLNAQGARAIAFDLLFDRPREAPGDTRLAEALRRAGNVALVAYLQRETLPTGGGTASVDRLLPPLPAFADAAMATAPFALVKSPEGALEYLGFAPEGDDLPSLPLVLAARHRPEALAPLLAAAGIPADSPHGPLEALRRQALGDPTGTVASPAPGDSAATLAWRRRLSTPAVPIPLNLYGPPGQVRTLGYDQALAALRQGGPEAERLFRGRSVLVGLSEFNQPEQRDVYRTPWSTGDGLDISGVELAATALANQLDGATLRRGPPLVEAALLAGIAALLLAPWRFLPIRPALACSVLLAGGYAVLAALAFSRSNLWLPWALPLFAVWPLSLLAGIGLRLREVDHQRQRLRAALARYGPREEVARLARRLRRVDDTGHVACLSTDIEGYTRRTEGRSPTEAREWLNRYFETAFPIVRRHGGHVVDHAGDAMVCIWLCGTDPRDACRAAVAAARELHARLNGVPLDGEAAFPTRIGLHFGPVSLGEVGDAQHAEQRIVGDIVNTASRIQSANKPLGTRVLVSDAVAVHLPEGEPLRPLGRFLLTGKSRDVGLVDPLPADPAQCRLHAQALQAWREGRWQAMRQPLAELLAGWPSDGPARFLQARVDDAGALPRANDTPLGDQQAFTLFLK
jgi:adenylate cyclase